MVAYSNDYRDYRLETAIGFGAASIVHSAIYDPPNPSTSESIRCAIKISNRQPDVDQWLEEVRILSSCRHPNVLQIHAAFTIPPDHYQVAIVTPLIAGGSLLSLMAWRATLPAEPPSSGLFRSTSSATVASHVGCLTEEEVKAVLKQVLSGLGYLHSQGIVHRDVKAGNILLDTDGTVLLADLGIGARVSEVDGQDAAMGMVGSPYWMAPEVILHSKCDHKSDVWSLGIALIELSSGSVPLAHLPPIKAMSQIANSPPPTLPPKVGASKLYLSLLDLCLAKKPSDRSSASQLVQHPFLRNVRAAPWLAGQLLKDVPPLVYRQEIHRKPSVLSMHSLASSWNFDPTPAGSVSTTPIRTTHRLPRSPSASTSASGRSHLFAPNLRRRSASRSSLGWSVPPSPEAGFSRLSWAEYPAIPPIFTQNEEPGDITMREEPNEREVLSTPQHQGITPDPESHEEHTSSVGGSQDFPIPPSTGLHDPTSTSIPIQQTMTSRSAESDIPPITPLDPPADGSVLLAELGASPVKGAVGKERKGLFGRRWSIRSKAEDEDESRVVRTLRGFRGR